MGPPIGEKERGRVKSEWLPLPPVISLSLFHVSCCMRCVCMTICDVEEGTEEAAAAKVAVLTSVL